MTKLVALAVVGLFAVGCGADFTGEYEGNLTSSGSCSDGSGLPMSTFLAEFEIEDNGDVLAVEFTDGDCATFEATTAAGSATATLKPKTCASASGNGFTLTPSITGGSLSLAGEKLAVSMQLRLDFSGGLSGFCNATAVGDLTREK